MDPVHRRLEDEFASYVGSRCAIAVNTGGMAIQIVLRALGVTRGDEVVHQVDTCTADAFAILNSGASPRFVDVDPETFMIAWPGVADAISNRTRVLMPIHMWGNPEDMDQALRYASERHLFLIEDACLALGAEWRGRRVGSFGRAAVFSFGCLKPIQAGEGGMIVTDDEALAAEVRSLRDWGAATGELGASGDFRVLGWNGRIPEIVAAVALEQLRGYPAHLESLREGAAVLGRFLSTVDGLQLLADHRREWNPAWTQAVLRVDERAAGRSKASLMSRMRDVGIRVWHASFEPLPSFSFFRSGRWRAWTPTSHHQSLASNYERSYPNAERVHVSTGLGINKVHLMSRRAVRELLNGLETALKS